MNALTIEVGDEGREGLAELSEEATVCCVHNYRHGSHAVIPPTQPHAVMHGTKNSRHSKQEAGTSHHG